MSRHQSGLDLGGLVSCDNPQILALEANADPKLRDYLALTCALVDPTP